MCRINTNQHKRSDDLPSNPTLVAPCVEVPGEAHERDVHAERAAGDEVAVT